VLLTAYVGTVEKEASAHKELRPPHIAERRGQSDQCPQIRDENLVVGYFLEARIDEVLENCPRFKLAT